MFVPPFPPHTHTHTHTISIMLPANNSCAFFTPNIMLHIQSVHLSIHPSSYLTKKIKNKQKFKGLKLSVIHRRSLVRKRASKFSPISNKASRHEDVGRSEGTPPPISLGTRRRWVLVSISKCYMVQTVPPSRAGMSKLWIADQKRLSKVSIRCTATDTL